MILFSIIVLRIISFFLLIFFFLFTAERWLCLNGELASPSFFLFPAAHRNEKYSLVESTLLDATVQQ